MELDPEQFVKMQASERYPDYKRQPPLLVTKCDPNMVKFTKDVGFADINAFGDQRYHKEEYCTNIMAKPAPSRT